MPHFEQLPGEPADAFEQLLIHRDAGPGRIFSHTAEISGSSESTLRRRADQWNWLDRLEAYDSALLQQIAAGSSTEALERYEQLLKEFRDLQLDRARRVGQLADELLALAKCSLLQHKEAGTVLQGRELPAVITSACKAIEGAMNIEATALGISELLDEN